MGLKLMKCPACGGNLNIETDTNVIFCQHCGAKLMNVNERIVIEHVDRKINETEERRISLEEKRFAHSMKVQKITAIVSIVAVIAGVYMRGYPKRFGYGTGEAVIALGVMLLMFIGIGGIMSAHNRQDNSKDKK